MYKIQIEILKKITTIQDKLMIAWLLEDEKKIKKLILKGKKLSNLLKFNFPAITYKDGVTRKTTSKP